MKTKLVITTTMEFEDKASMDVFIRTMPLTPSQHQRLIDGGSVLDPNDESPVPGVKSLLHKFSTEGKEEQNV